ncbi:hypothetical protein ACFXKD_20695 [Nocardiopsis aegyptia]|uniref:hypothetical protein n=1 Tax=Nocardiopsis aegyptia TaxID=220378 RepID=UPI00366FA05F
MLYARSTAEAFLYLDLHLCSCEYPALDQVDDWLEKRDGVFVAVFDGRCSTCSGSGRYEFELETAELVRYPAIGGSTPSRIIDPGEFLWLSDRAASEVPVDVTGPSKEELGVAHGLMRRAIVTLEEVLKFIPEGDDEVPESAFSSDLGRSLREESPERFRREEITARLAFYRSGVRELEA